MNPELVSLIEAVIQALAPIVAKMIDRAMSGGDPWAALAAEHPDVIIPEPLKLLVAEAAARARVSFHAPPLPTSVAAVAP